MNLNRVTNTGKSLARPSPPWLVVAFVCFVGKAARGLEPRRQSPRTGRSKEELPKGKREEQGVRLGEFGAVEGRYTAVVLIYSVGRQENLHQATVQTELQNEPNSCKLTKPGPPGSESSSSQIKSGVASGRVRGRKKGSRQKRERDRGRETAGGPGLGVGGAAAACWCVCV